MTENHSNKTENRLSVLETKVSAAYDELEKVNAKIDAIKSERSRVVTGAALLFGSVLWANRANLGF